VEWKSRNFYFHRPSSTVSQKTYIDFLKTSLLPECRRLYPDNDFVFMQDSASSHRAKQLKIFFETTRPISLARKNGYRIRQI